MRFSDPQNVLNTCQHLKMADEQRSYNRALINRLFNGEQPFTAEEEQQNQISTNVNFLTAARMAHDARNTFTNAFFKPGNYFTVTVDSGPIYKKDSYGRIITKNLNKILKKSLPYTETLRAKFAQTVLHGIGPSNWEGPNVWCPTPIAIDDIFFPSRTRASMDNTEYFAIYRQYTPSKLWEMTQGEHVDEGWNTALAKELILEKTKEGLQSGNTNSAWQTPEKIAEAIKADVGLLDTDSIPTINCWDFYYQEERKGKRAWYRCMVLDYPEGSLNKSKFLYKPRRAFADELVHIIHMLYADGSAVAPFRYHSIRGLGWMLYGVCHLDNRLRCRFNDAVFESLLQLFRVNTPEDRAKLDMIDLYNKGVVPEGLSFVTAAERHEVDQQLVAQAFAMNRQNIAESSAQFRSDVNDGTSKEMTAAEVMAKVNAANALVGSMLQMSYTYESHEQREIARRFCQKNPTNPDIKKFQEDCKKEGVPKDCFDIEKWTIEPERVLGAGNKTLEIAQAEKLMAARPLYNPEAQQEILHIYTEAMTDDPQLAERLVPPQKKKSSSAITEAQQAFGALMWGAPVVKANGLNNIEYIEAMITSLGAVISQIQGGEQMQITATPQQIIGLKNVVQHIGQQLQVLAQDKNEKQRVARYGAALGQFNNLIKAFEQHAMEKLQSSQTGLSADDQAKIQKEVLKTQSTLKLKDASALQKRQQRQMDFEAKQRRDQESHELEMSRLMDESEIERAKADLETAAKITRERATTE